MYKIRNKLDRKNNSYINVRARYLLVTGVLFTMDGDNFRSVNAFLLTNTHAERRDTNAHRITLCNGRESMVVS